MILLMPARWIAYRLPGSKVPPLGDDAKLTAQEEEMNDPSIVWPSPIAIAKLPKEWIVQEISNGKIEEETSPATEVNTKPKVKSSSKKRRSTNNRNQINFR